MKRRDISHFFARKKLLPARIRLQEEEEEERKKKCTISI